MGLKSRCWLQEQFITIPLSCSFKLCTLLFLFVTSFKLWASSGSNIYLFSRTSSVCLVELCMFI